MVCDNVSIMKLKMFVKRVIWLLSPILLPTNFLGELEAEFDIRFGRTKKFDSVEGLIGYLNGERKEV